MAAYYARDTARSPGRALETSNGSTPYPVGCGFITVEGTYVQARIGNGSWTNIGVPGAVDTGSVARSASVTCGSTPGTVEFRYGTGATLSQPWVLPSDMAFVAGNAYTITVGMRRTSDPMEEDPDSLTLYWGAATPNLGSVDGTFGSSASPPGTVTGVTATGGATGITVAHDAITGATSYKLYRNTTDTPPGSPLSTGLTGTSHLDSTAEPGVTYYYWLKATNANGDSASFSSSASAAKVAPVIASTTTDEHGAAIITATGTFSGVQLYRASSAGGTYSLVDGGLYTAAESPADTWTIIDPLPTRESGIAWGDTVYYKVRGTYGSDTSDSPVCSATPSVDVSAVESGMFAALHGFISSQTGGYVSNVYPAEGEFYSFYWLTAMAYAYKQTSTASYLTDVSNQWTHEKSLVAANHLWENSGYLSSLGYNAIDHQGRFVWYTLMAAILLARAGESTVSAEMYAYVDDGAQAVLDTFGYDGSYNLASIYDPDTHIGNTFIGYALNQRLWVTAALAYLRHLPTSALYGDTIIDSIVTRGITVAAADIDANGRFEAAREIGYHSADLTALELIKQAYGAGWSTTLDGLVDDATTYTTAYIAANGEDYDDGNHDTYFQDAMVYDLEGLAYPVPLVQYTRTRLFPTNNAPAYDDGVLYAPEGFAGSGTVYAYSERGIAARSIQTALASVPIQPAIESVTFDGTLVHVTLTDNASNEDGIRWKVAYDGGAYGEVTTIATADTTSFTFTPTEGWASLKVAVCAYNADGDSGYAESDSLAATEPIEGSFGATRIVSENVTGGFDTFRVVSETLAGTLAATRLVSENIAGTLPVARIVEVTGSEAIVGTFGVTRLVSETLSGHFHTIRVVESSVVLVRARVIGTITAIRPGNTIQVTRPGGTITVGEDES